MNQQAFSRLRVTIVIVVGFVNSYWQANTANAISTDSRIYWWMGHLLVLT